VPTLPASIALFAAKRRTQVSMQGRQSPVTWESMQSMLPPEPAYQPDSDCGGVAASTWHGELAKLGREGCDVMKDATGKNMRKWKSNHQTWSDYFIESVNDCHNPG